MSTAEAASEASRRQRAARLSEGRPELGDAGGGCPSTEGAIRGLPLVEGAAEQAGRRVSATVSQPRPVFGTAAADTTATRKEFIIGLEVTA